MRAEERIKTRTALTVIENGRDLIEVKKALEHGQFTAWVEQAFGGTITMRTAQMWMNAAEMYGDKIDLRSNLGSKVMQLLAAPSTPDEVREQIETRALAGGNFQQLERLAHPESGVERTPAKTGAAGRQFICADCEKTHSQGDTFLFN